ncbi:MAG: sugar phosphate nucleotidyltransferase, partial [Candidatus Planktophila sp.]
DQGSKDEPVVIFNGDILSKHDLAAQIAFHQSMNADVTLHLIEVADARAFGCVPTDSQGRVEAFLEKMDNPVTNWINAGCYVFSREVIHSIPKEKVVSVERETFPSLIDNKRRVYGYKEAAYWLDIGTPAALFQGSRDFVDGPSLLSSSAVVDPTAQVIGGSAIGGGCTIAAAAFVDDSIVMEGAGIGEGARVTRSFIAPGAQIPAGAQIVDRYISKTENSAIIF